MLLGAGSRINERIYLKRTHTAFFYSSQEPPRGGAYADLHKRGHCTWVQWRWNLIQMVSAMFMGLYMVGANNSGLYYYIS